MPLQALQSHSDGGNRRRIGDKPCHVQREVRKHLEEEHAAVQAGMYRQSPQDWLASSWQGDALQVILASQSCLLPVNTNATLQYSSHIAQMMSTYPADDGCLLRENRSPGLAAEL